MAITLPSMPGRPIRDQTVDLRIQVNESNCTAPQNIRDWHDQWMQVSIPEIITSATIHFQGASLRRIPDETLAEARKRTAWERLWNSDPRGILANGHTRFVVNRGDNSDEQGQLTFLLGDAVSVAVVKRILGIPLTAVKKRNFNQHVRHDFDVLVGRRKLKLETRGRFDANNRKKALKEIDDKFGKQRDFSQAIGALVYPSARPGRRIPDVELIDPEQSSGDISDADLARHVLEYYLDLLLDIGATASSEISRLLALSDRELMNRLASRQALSATVSKFALNYWGPSAVSIGEVNFRGITYDEFPGLPWVSEKHRESNLTLFWGIWEGVLDRLGNLELLDLIDMQPPNFADAKGAVQAREMDNGATLILHDDGVLIVLNPDQLPDGNEKINWKKDGF